MADLPGVVQYATIFWQGLLFAPDSNDAGRLPDRAPAQGKVTFLADTERVRFASASPNPFTMFPQVIPCLLDANGYLLGPDGTQDVVVPATGQGFDTYTVLFELTGIKSFTRTYAFPALPDVNGVAQKHDLSAAIELPQSPNTDIAAYILTRQAAETAAAAAAASAASINPAQFIKKVNGVTPDSAGNVTVAGGGGGGASTIAQITDSTTTGQALVKATDAASARATLALNLVTNTADADKPVSTAQATAIAGRVPTSRTIAGKALTADVTLAKADVGLSSVDNTADLSKPVSAAQQAALDVKVSTSRTVAGKPLTADVTLAKADVGLASVDNTADTAKPVSTAQQTALDGKVPTTRTVAGKALSGDVTLVKADVGLSAVDNTSDSAKPLSTATVTELVKTPWIVEHGTNAATARPTTTRPVNWRGSVYPTNIITGDSYTNLSDPVEVVLWWNPNTNAWPTKATTDAPGTFYIYKSYRYGTVPQPAQYNAATDEWWQTKP